MARSMMSLMLQAARAAERQQRANEREFRRQEREALRFEREEARASIAANKDARRAYLEERQTEVDDLNRELAERVSMLGALLAASLRHKRFSIRDLMAKPDLSPIDRDQKTALYNLSDFDSFRPKPPGAFAKLLPGAGKRYAALYDQAVRKYQGKQQAYNAMLARREAAIKALHANLHEQNRPFHEIQAGYDRGDPQAVAAYLALALSSSDYPEDLSPDPQVAYLAESKHLVVDLALPACDELMPAVEKYRYIKSSDSIAETGRAQKSRHALYSAAVAQIALRTLHEIRHADALGHVGVITLNGYVNSIDRVTGQFVKPCVVSVRSTVEALAKIDLSKVDATACLKGLSATISRSPAELVAIKPILSFDMNDPRFISEADVLSTLDTRPNLMDLTPSEFETLITNLFQKMGLDTKQTQASRDGGVDCVAYDLRPVLGGKVIIQAKRYKNTVGVSAVRDLFGTMMNEGASKGILVTTSGFGNAAFEFAKSKPIELLEGPHLLHMLAEYAGVDARIIIPAAWADE